MNKNLLIGLGVGLVVLTAATFAYASTNGYSSWKTFMGDRGGRASQVINENNFGQFQQMHQMMADGKYVEAEKARTELGLGQGKTCGGQGGGCAAKSGSKQGGCAMHNGGADKNFVDANNNEICDRME